MDVCLRNEGGKWRGPCLDSISSFTDLEKLRVTLSSTEFYSVSSLQCLMVLTVGLQLSFRSVKIALAIPLILRIIVFKIFMDRKFNKNFHYYLPDTEELHAAHVHSTCVDTVKQKLQNRFGHPSLHPELFTPMVHADQMYLLRQVYGCKIEEGTDDGKTCESNVEVLDGLRITAIRQSELQYDPVLYSRDRGEYAFDNDRFSLASTSMLSNSRVSQYEGGTDIPLPSYGIFKPRASSLRPAGVHDIACHRS
ncbi:hypothetical protein B0H17DRAFT_1136815 [Mycena rosella]|uniref:Uncharacterized protein n=1 Tax=Mycena rosella TaxID=1033263 RepID=A0AAD7DB92_MYCRO|nr:hypothetical protein B0H17DRAFT_1136815 [Mycena rosella]